MGEIKRSDLKIGMLVEILSDNECYRGYIQEITTKTNSAKKVKVVLNDGQIGYVDHIVTKEEFDSEQFKFYNLFFYEKEIYSIWNKRERKYLVDMVSNVSRQVTEPTGFLFTDKKVAKDVLKAMDCDLLMLKKLNRRKLISENFKTCDVKFFRINEMRKVSLKKLNERETFYNNVR